MPQAKKAIILGSGVSVKENESPYESIKYSDIPSWPVGKVKGHKGTLDKYSDLWVLRGRAHIYEGFSWEQACFPTKYLAENGIEEIILTNAAGGINSDFEIGDLMQITGFIDLLKPNKSRANLECLKQPVQSFKTDLIEGIHHGNYIGVHGPNYETDAEVSLFKTLGADAVGMSTIPELETAIKHNMKITAISVITNVYGKTEDLGHEGVLEAAKSASQKLVKLLAIE